MKSVLPIIGGFFLGLAQLSAQTPSGGADITYNLPRAAKVSLNVLNDKGWIVRELLRADQEDAGPHTVHWDGNDQMGRPQPPGAYSWKLLHHTGLKADYVLSVGNSGQPPYRTDDDKGSWGGCHGNPLSIQADASGLYISWLIEEGNAVFAHTDYDGHNLYKIHNSQGWGRSYDSAIVGPTLYRLECGAGSYIEKYDLANGKYTTWDAKSDQISGGKLRIEKVARPLPAKAAPITPQGPFLDEPDAVAMAANADYVVASFPNLNKIAVFKTTGEQLDDLPMDQPKGLLFLTDGRLVVAQPGKIVAVNLAKRSVQSLVTKNLVSPWGVALSRDGRSLWVTDQGILNKPVSNIGEWWTDGVPEQNRSYQVKQFDLNGKLLTTIGKPGGMSPEGSIDHMSFFRPRGIACGTDGNIYVTEDSPLRRITRWSPEGKLLREWFGPEGPQRSCWPNLNNFSEVYYQSATDGIIQCKVDLAKKTWYPVAWSQAHVGHGQPYVFESHGRKFLYDDHSTLFVLNSQSGAWQPALSFSTLKDKKQAALWTDLNGNGQVDDGETQTISLDDLKARTRLLGASFDLAFGRFDPATMVLHGVMGNNPVRLEPSKFTDQGIPVYSFDKITCLAQQPARGPGGWSDEMIYYTQGNIPAADGGFFTAYNGGRQGGARAWDRANWNYLIKFGSNGLIQWQAGVHALNRVITNPADIGMIMRLAGGDKGMVFLTDVEEQFHAYTDDGLYVDSLMNTGPSLTPNSLTVENVTGLVAEDPVTHETYLFAGSTEDSRIWHITGFDSIQRMEGKLTLKTADIPSAPADTYTIAATKPPRVPAGDFDADGFLNEPEWRQAAELPLVDNGVLKARIYLRHDDQYLWVGAHVIDSTPAENNAQDPETAFTRGDCLDLYFGADPDADSKRETADVGDVRVLLYPTAHDAMYNGAIVVYRMKVAPGAEKHPFEFTSPAGDVSADSVTTITDKDSVTKGGPCTFYRWPDGAGYTVEAKIPLSALPELGLNTPTPVDHKIAFDVGVIYSNEAGNDRASRLYWHQEDARTQTVQDLPTEAQFYPRLWGIAEISTVIAPSK